MSLPFWSKARVDPENAVAVMMSPSPGGMRKALAYVLVGPATLAARASPDEKRIRPIRTTNHFIQTKVRGIAATEIKFT